MRGMFCLIPGMANATARNGGWVKDAAHADSWGPTSAQRICCELLGVLDAPYGMLNVLRAILPCSFVASLLNWANLPAGLAGLYNNTSPCSRL